MIENEALHTLYADGTKPAAILLSIDAGLIVRETSRASDWKSVQRNVYFAHADYLVAFMLKHMPGGLVDAVFAKLAAHKAGLFVVPHITDRQTAGWTEK